MEDARRRRRLTENARDGRDAAREVRRAAPRSSLASENLIAPPRRAPEDGAIRPRAFALAAERPRRARRRLEHHFSAERRPGSRRARRESLVRRRGRSASFQTLKLHRSFSLPTRVTHVHLHARVPARRGIARLASRTNIRAHARRMFSRASLVHVRSQTRTLDASRSR